MESPLPAQNYQPQPEMTQETAHHTHPAHHQTHTESKAEHNLYTRSTLSIFWRNFVAGLGHALGGIILYLIFAFFVIRFISTYLLPPLEPLFRSFENLSRLTNMPIESNQTENTNRINNILDKIDSIELPSQEDINSQFGTYNQ